MKANQMNVLSEQQIIDYIISFEERIDCLDILIEDGEGCAGYSVAQMIEIRKEMIIVANALTNLKMKMLKSQR